MASVLHKWCILLLIVAAAGISGCLGGDHDHDHDHDHGDPDAAYVPLNGSQLSEISSGNVLFAAVSVIPQTEFVEKVGGEKVIAAAMIPAGAGHTYDPSPGQLEDLSKADIYFSLDSGEVFETKYLATFRALNPDMTVVGTSAGLDVSLKNGTADPHIWMSPVKARTMVENICAGLVKADPENASFYVANKDAYVDELVRLDEYIRTALDGKTNRTIIVYHPAWGHFADEYGLTQIAIELDGKEPTARSLSALIDTARRENVSVIFVQQQLSTTAAQAIAEETGARVVTLDPLAKDYVSAMRQTADIMAGSVS